jgi:cytoskeleton protein RodZ
MDDLGLRLKRAREARGLALKDLAAKTKLSASALEALERCDYARLPGGIFGRSFVRAYATEVGVNPDETVAEFVELLEKDERERAARTAVRPEVTADDRAFLERQRRALRVLQIVLGLLAILAIVLIGWQVRAWWQRSAARRAAVSGVQVLAAASEDPLPSSPAGATSVPGAGTAGAGAVLSVTATSVSSTTATTTPASMTSSGPFVLDPAEPLVIELEVATDCWVAVTADGRAAGSELMRAGSKRRFEGQRELTFDVGNAGAITWTINGRPAKPLGRAGVHVRTRVSRDNAASLLQ